MSSRDSAFLAAGSAANGLLSYAFFVMASRSLGAENAAPISVLWSYWAMAGAVLTFPVQHWIIRRFVGDGHEGGVSRSFLRLSAVVAGIVVASGLLAFAFRHALFDTGGVAFPAMIAGITAGSFLMGVVRGVLSGRDRYRATAASLVAENALRVVAAGVVIAVGGAATAFGVAMVVGPLVSLFWVRSLRFGTAPPDAAGIRNPLALLSGVAGGSLVSQLVLTGSPVVLAVAGGAPAEVTSLFLALAVWRAPYLVAMGVTPQLTNALTRVAVDAPARRMARTGRITVAAVLAGVALAVALGATVLQPVLSAVFGPDVRMSAAELAAVGAGTVVALGNLVLLLILLALGRSRVTSAAWGVGLATAAAWMVLASAEPLRSVIVAFVLAELSAFVLLVVAVETTSARGTTKKRHDLRAIS